MGLLLVLKTLAANWRVLAALGLAVALAAGLLWIDKRAYQRGVTATTATWQAREIRELAAANAEILRLQAEVANKERQAAESIAALAGLHQEEMAHAQANRDRFLDDLYAGRVRIRPELTACEGAGRGPADSAAPAGRSDDPQAGHLPRALQGAVAGGAKLAAEADEVVAQLELAQGVIEEYRKACR